MNFETSKNLGGVGAILMFISVLPYVGTYTFGLLGIVGFILVLVGMKGLADYYREAGIFNNALYGTITGIVGGVALVVAFVAIIVTTATDFISDVIPSWSGEWTDFPQITSADISTNINYSTIGSLLVVVLLSLVILFVIVLISAIFYRKSLNLLRDKTGVGMFGTAGTLLLIGAVLTIIGIGLILVWIAVLLAAIAFFQLRPQQTAPPAPPPPSETPVQL